MVALPAKFLPLSLAREFCAGMRGIQWKFTTVLDDLDFVDDIALTTCAIRLRGWRIRQPEWG